STRSPPTSRTRSATTLVVATARTWRPVRSLSPPSTAPHPGSSHTTARSTHQLLRVVIIYRLSLAYVGHEHVLGRLAPDRTLLPGNQQPDRTVERRNRQHLHPRLGIQAQLGEVA